MERPARGRWSTLADKIYGRGGNDTLYGRGGKDLLVGGPGTDRVVCGAGRDTVVADVKDRVAKDCEVVRRTTPPPPPTEPPPTEPPPPSPPPAPTALPGLYCGFTLNGQSICFDVTPDGRGFTGARFGAETDCSPSSRFVLTINASGVAPLGTDLSFDYEIASGDLSGSNIKGKFDTQGNSSGTVHLQAAFDYGGTHYTCTFDTDWTAKIQR